MKKKSNKKEVILTSIIILLIVAAIILGYLWISLPEDELPEPDYNQTTPPNTYEPQEPEIPEEPKTPEEPPPPKEPEEPGILEPNEPGEEWPYKPFCYDDEYDDTTSCENGIIRMRPTKTGIIWFDFYHKKEDKWYVNKNNLNLVAKVEGNQEWQNTELKQVQPRVELLQEDENEIRYRYHFNFPNGAKIYLDTIMRRGDSYLDFEVHKKSSSKKITGFQWHITFGQAEAVERLHFDGNNIFVNKLPRPFPGGRLEIQYTEWFTNLNDLNFRFWGTETQESDPNNPKWMSRSLGLKQHVIWGKPMGPQDHFAFEARDQPWQPNWKVPQKTPWIEGLWFIRNKDFQSDELTFGFENWEEYS